MDAYPRRSSPFSTALVCRLSPETAWQAGAVENPGGSPVAARRGRIVVLNGMPCSGKSTLASALQDAMSEPWLVLDLDVFTPKLPPRRIWSEPAVLRQIIAGGNAAVAAVAAAGNNIIVELVARHDPGACLVLDDLFGRLADFDTLVVTLRCSVDTATEREMRRPAEMQGLVQRDHGKIDDQCFDASIDTDTLTIPDQVRCVRQALSTGTTGGLDRLRAHVHARAMSICSNSAPRTVGDCSRRA